MLRPHTIEDTLAPMLDVLVPLKEVEFQLMPHLVPTALSVRRGEENSYVWHTKEGTLTPAESVPFRIYWARIKALYYAIINPDLLDALDALPEETKSEWWYKVYRLCAEEVYFGEIRHMHPEDLEATLYINVKELTMFFHNATMPTPESLNA